MLFNLQDFEFLYADFSVPESYFPEITPGLEVYFKVSAFPGKTFIGLVEAIDAKVDEATRNINVRAQLQNHDAMLLPGMYAEIYLVLEQATERLLVPSTAIVFSSFGDAVFVIKQDQQSNQIAQRVQVTTGEQRGDLVEILEGLSGNEEVVQAGTSKLRNKPQVHVLIDRAKAGQLGISMRTIGNTLATQMGDFRSNYFDIGRRSYEVIPQADTDFQQTREAISRLYVETQSGTQVPLSTVVKVKREVVPNDLTQFQQLNSATIEAMPMPGQATIADAHEFLENTLAEIAPSGFMHDYGGQSRQFNNEGSALMTTAAMVLGILPLVAATGAGAVSRNNIGLVITVGLSVGTLFTLFVIPVMYALISRQVEKEAVTSQVVVTTA